MTADLATFSDGEFVLNVREHETDGFRVHAPGLARALGFREAFDLVRNIPKEEKGSELVRTPGGYQPCWYVTEAGFYRALGQRQAARIPDEGLRLRVERFQTWVYREVLPAIRKTGRYEVAELTELEVARKYVAALEDKQRLEATIAEQAPAVEAWNYLINAEGDYSVREAAQVLCRAGIDTGQKRLFAKLRDLKWIDRNGMPYQAQIETGRVVARATTYEHPRTGERVATSQVRITSKGVEWLLNHLGPRRLRALEGGAAS